MRPPAYRGVVELQDGQEIGAATAIRICGPQLVLRPFRPEEIEEQWLAVVNADPMTVAGRRDESAFKARLLRSGHLVNGWLDLAVDLDGMAIGRIQTFVPPDRPLPPGTFDVGMGLLEHLRGRGYGREALMLLTDWLFEHAEAQVVEASTEPANAPMRAVFRHCGWALAGEVSEGGRNWIGYQITRSQWEAARMLHLWW
jgi:RimJ/RimL family protein N-acetyltransferase